MRLGIVRSQLHSCSCCFKLFHCFTFLCTGPVLCDLHCWFLLLLAEPRALSSSMSVRSSNNRAVQSLPSAPEPPDGITFPTGFRPKRCVRCGVWSTQTAQYQQELSPEKAWGKLVAWEAGNLQNPQGRHCLLCRKAGACSLCYLNTVGPFGNVWMFQRTVSYDLIANGIVHSGILND